MGNAGEDFTRVLKAPGDVGGDFVAGEVVFPTGITGDGFEALGILVILHGDLGNTLGPRRLLGTAETPGGTRVTLGRTRGT